uniref:Small nuclear ribonucleoprotein Sm D2 n=1 Tax=Moschus moschiferus TaxID=68415 RepID=A0A8C6CVR6_MOSMO
LVLRNLKEIWTQVAKSGKGKKSKPVNKDHGISKMLLCKDSVTIVSQNPLIACKWRPPPCHPNSPPCFVKTCPLYLG